MSLIRAQYFDYTVTIDDHPVRLRLKRLTVPEFCEFRAMLSSLGQNRGAPHSLAHLDAEHVSIDDVKAESAYLRANAEWQQQVFEAYVSVVSGDVFDVDDQGNQIEVTSGRHFADLFHGQGVIADILAQLYLANTLTEDQKKKLPSRSDSATGSNTEPKTATPGVIPAPIADAVAPPDSASAAAAMAPPSDPSSGTMGRSSSEPVPCAI